MVDAFLGWGPLLWTARIVLLILLVGIGMVSLGVVFRLVRHARLLLAGPLPVLREVGVKGSVFGQEIAANAVLDVERDEQVRALAAAVAHLEKGHTELKDLVDRIRPDWR